VNEPGILAPRTFPDVNINMFQHEPRTLSFNAFKYERLPIEPPDLYMKNSMPFNSQINHLTPNDHFSGRTAQLTSRCCIFLFIQQIYVLNILNMLHTLYFFPLQNAIYFIILPFWFLYYSHFIYRVC